MPDLKPRSTFGYYLRDLLIILGVRWLFRRLFAWSGRVTNWFD